MPKKDEIIYEKEKKPKKEKKKSRGTGKFFLGWFLGTIINIALIVGFGFWFYKNGTINSIEKTFGFEISVLSEDSKHWTIEKLVGDVMDVAANYDRIELRVDKGQKDALKAHAESRGETLNGLVNRAIQETLERDNAGK